MSLRLRAGGLRVTLEARFEGYAVHVRGRGTIGDVRQLMDLAALWVALGGPGVSAFIPCADEQTQRLARLCGMRVAECEIEGAQWWRLNPR